MSIAIAVNNGVMHPQEGKCLAINLTAGVAANLDVSSLTVNGDMVTIYNNTSNVLGYKFSSSATPNISVTSTGGADACLRMQTNTSERGYAPYGCNNLHLISPGPGYVYVCITSIIH